MSAIYALFATGEKAQDAVTSLLMHGVPADDIQVLSAAPLELAGLSHSRRETPMTALAAAGGLTGMLAGYALTRFTQMALPLNVGGMPVVTNWTNLIVIFELTMLGVVITSVVTFLLRARIPRRRPALYDREVSDGRILVGVDQPADPGAVVKALQRGALRTVRLE
jgi:hypothetical protein